MKIRVREQEETRAERKAFKVLPEGLYEAELFRIKPKSGSKGDGQAWDAYMLMFKVISGEYKGECATAFCFISNDKEGYPCLVKGSFLYDILVMLNNGQDIENLDIYDFLHRTAKIKVSNKPIRGKTMNVVDAVFLMNQSPSSSQSVDKTVKQIIKQNVQEDSYEL